MQKVWNGRPWLFDNQLFVLKEFEGYTPLHRVNFDYECLWVWMHNLPLSCMTKERGVQIGGTMRRVEEVDVHEDGSGWGSFFRVQIYMDLTQPLARGRTINVKVESIWILFSYEKMPRICFSCGCAVHGVKGCSGILGESDGKEDQYGIWMRAT
ncbi:uncharacterized protein At4g02000-like [Carya illinoinensis]|uniref:uncharacterized protein At4g02000-like n=1 Tax=Carya illinoinensis TaxID=32201 RepID=UPI001C727E83|nr:uncharacterized protein At4g02000-like [Carya illinoinensis]